MAPPPADGMGARVVAAFASVPPTDAERLALRVLLARPGATTAELSAAACQGPMWFNSVFGRLCKRRAEWLGEPDPHERMRDTPFWSGLLAEVTDDMGLSRYRMKPEAAAALEAMGLGGRA